MCVKTCAFALFVLFGSVLIECKLLIAPQDLPQALAAIYGFSPVFKKGNDHRFGFGFSFGNHADFQVLYEFGPQTLTKPLQPPKVRSVAVRQRYVQRRPVLEFLVRAGFLKDSSNRFNLIHNCDDEPR